MRSRYRARYEWTESHPQLRVLSLPEEYYCPLEHRQKPWKDAAGAVWQTSWRNGIYRCRAVHGHRYFGSASVHFDMVVKEHLTQRQRQRQRRQHPQQHREFE